MEGQEEDGKRKQRVKESVDIRTEGKYNGEEKC